MLIQAGAVLGPRTRNGHTAADLAAPFPACAALVSTASNQAVVPMDAEPLAPPATRPFRLQIASDIHVEFFSNDNRMLSPDVITPSAPCLALLGDIGLAHEPRYEKFLLEMSRRFERVFFLAGNHEYYNTYGARYSLQQLDAKMRSICEAHASRLQYMDRTSVLLDGVRILGATLWTDIPEQYQQRIQHNMADYHVIFFDDPASADARLFTVADSVALHRQQMAWLEAELQKAKAAGERVIVLSHHVPSPNQPSAPEFGGDPGNHGFSTQLEQYFKEGSLGYPIDVWACGHTHCTGLEKAKAAGE
eukprot:TRINITY_DN14232_c0_g1_i1.p1 TRINITY_DN14232_c0_g1~~TRINITY_DN14232_c0_g1_i1.p1  ORF type:complete len:305 (+),score=45.87 TRINITY_DN14232_c0_g1_i1:534-1448(+)